jgi:group I intron endonuclease
MIIIYKLSYKDLVYVGKTKNDLRTRYRQHLKEAKDSSKPLYKAMREHGPNNFKIEVLEELNSSESARIRELYYIKEISNLNIQGRGSNTHINNVINELKVAISKAEQVLESLERLSKL